MIFVDLLVRGLRWDDPSTDAVLAQHLADIGWGRIDNDSLATVCAADVVDAARRIEKHLPGVQVVGVYRHLVSVNQIGSLTGIAPETVHLWLKRDDSFPKPYLNIDGYRMWVWGDVAAWLQETFHLAAADDELTSATAGHLEMLLRERVSM